MYTLDMTIILEPIFLSSPLMSLCTHLGMDPRKKNDIHSLVKALQKLLVHRTSALNSTALPVMARMIHRELDYNGDNRICIKDMYEFQLRMLRIFCGQPTTLIGCRQNAVLRFEKLSANGVITQQQMERKIHQHLPKFIPIKGLCTQLGCQFIFQMAKLSQEPIKAISEKEWLDCAEKLFISCSNISS
jgi:hypothetical protein